MGEPIRNQLSVQAYDDLLGRAGWRPLDDDVASDDPSRLGLLVAAPATASGAHSHGAAAPS